MTSQESFGLEKLSGTLGLKRPFSVERKSAFIKWNKINSYPCCSGGFPELPIH